ncbi:MAG: hypothetical protein GWN09_08575 [Gammaproteobacteria bacterium]|nr:hypothetical protein [Gammaproteobacteria bacterium]
MVVSEVGDDTREIVYFGDTINTTARLEQTCKELRRDFPISGDLVRRMKLPDEALGEVALPGKAHRLEVYALSMPNATKNKRTPQATEERNANAETSAWR